MDVDHAYSSDPRENQCDRCAASYKSLKSLLRHRRDKHGLRNTNYRIRCLEPNCTDTFAFIRHLERHLADDHKKVIDSRMFHFKSLDDFVRWREDYEEKNCVRFRRLSKSGNSRFISKVYFVCNRTGVFKSISCGKRRLKSQGSCKIGNYCTASIALTKLDETEESSYLARICFTHYGHDLELNHLPLPGNEKRKIASKLVEGMSISAVLDSVHKSVTPKQSKRVHLLKRKDLQNIKATIGSKSLEDWVGTEKSNPNFAFIVYKDRGAAGLGLNKEDSCLMLMTKPQAAVARNFGNGGLVCLDVVCGSYSSQYKLMTLLVLDEFHEGFPIAFFYSNRDDEAALSVFFTEVSSICGKITPLSFMSDDEEQYYLAWTAVMGAAAKKLICPWNLDRNWNVTIKKMGDDKSVVSQYLNVLQSCTNVDEFERLLPQVISKWMTDADAAESAKYFAKVYSNRPEQWAKCYLKNFGIQNGSLDYLHNTIHNVYMSSQSLDIRVQDLVKLARDKQWRRLETLLNAKKPHIGAYERHKASFFLHFESVKEQSGDWIVCDDSDELTVVSKLTIADDHQCLLKCSSCEACSHSYTCTCDDNVIEGEMCKHIHLICRFQMNEEIIEVKPTSEEKVTDSPNPVPAVVASEPLKYEVLDEEEDFDAIEHFQGHTAEPISLDLLKNEMMDLCQNVLINIMNAENIEVLQSMKPALLELSTIQ